MIGEIKTEKYGECVVIYGLEPAGEGRQWLWHLSISHPNRLPSYEELKGARYEFLPDNVYMAQIFPPKAEFINVMPYCLHLWEVPKNRV